MNALLRTAALIASALMLSGCHVTYIRVSIIDACNINPVFCDSYGNSEVPGFKSGVATYRQLGKSPPTLRIGIENSLANSDHEVYLCPGVLTEDGGFQDCSSAGNFKTDHKGNGEYQGKVKVTEKLDSVIALNVGSLGTVLANCPDQPNTRCQADPLE